MKKTIALVLAVLLAVSSAVTVSAGGLFKGGNEVQAQNEAASGVKTSGVFKESGKAAASDSASKDKTAKESTLILNGWKYYSLNEAGEKLNKYFKRKSTSFYMTKGEQRFFAGVYLLPADRTVLEYDEETCMLEAKASGSTEVYVYSEGGVPFYRFDITVVNETAVRKAPKDILCVTPSSAAVKIGSDVTFKVSAVKNGTLPDELYYVIEDGSECGSIDRKTGKFTASGSGVAVIRAYDPMDVAVYGEAVVLVGPVTSAVSYYDIDCKSTKGSVVVKNFSTIWKYYSYICGWIIGDDGYPVPVFRPIEATVEYPGGEKRDTKVLIGEAAVAALKYNVTKGVTNKATIKQNPFAHEEDIFQLDKNDYRILLYLNLIESFKNK